MSADAPERARSSRPSLLATAPPSVAVEVAQSHVTVVSVDGIGRNAVISGYAVEPLPSGIVTPALNGTNVHEGAALAATIQTALQKVAGRTRRVALVVPDTTAKVSLIRFEKVPAKYQDLDQLIRWQIRKTAPFRIEDAQVSWIRGIDVDGGGREFVVAGARRDII